MSENVAIDGPAGAGKSTVAELLARKLGYLYIDTGSMYRAVTLKALRNNIDIDDGSALTEMAENTELELEGSGLPVRVIIDGEEVTTEIRKPEISNLVSMVAKVSGVRKRLVAIQQQIAARGDVVMDGRDIGTNVLPDARYKFFLTADVNERAMRRYQELIKKGYSLSFEAIKDNLKKRDLEDSTREHSPLVKAPDAVLIDTTRITPEDVVKVILRHIGG